MNKLTRKLFSILWVIFIFQAVSFATAQSDRTGVDQTNIIQFPEDRSLGVLYVAPSEIQSRENFFWFGPEFVKLGFAQGRVEVPPHTLVRLDVSVDACSDLSPLSQIPPDSIHGLYFNINADPSDQFGHIGKLTGLRFLSFRSVPISDGRLLKLVELANLEQLDCEVDGHVDQGFGMNDRAMMVISRFKNLKRLSLRSNPITDEGLRHLEACQKLESLDLDGTKVTGEGFSHLLKLPNLKLLSLGAYENGAPVDDRGMELIGQMQKLAYLSLNGTKVTDEGLKHVSGLKNLESLSLDYTQVTEEGLASLAGLEKLRSLRVQGFARGGLQSLGDRAAEHLSKVPNLENVVGRWSLTQPGFEHLGRMKKIKSLTFHGNVTDDQLNNIASLASLEELNLYSCPVTDVGIEKIVNLRKLSSVSIHETKITGACLQTFRKIDTLRRLRISFEAFGPESHWSFLGELKGLEALDIGAPEFGKTACSALAKLARLKELEVSHPMVGSDFFEAVVGMKNLESLRFVASDVGPESWQKIAQLNNLEYLDFRGEITNDQLMLFADMPSLRIFQNHSKKLSLQGIEEFIKKSKSIQSFLHPLMRKDANATD